MNLTYKEFRLIKNIVKHCNSLLSNIDTVDPNYYNKVKDIFIDIVNCDISYKIMNGCLISNAIDNINHECDIFVNCLRFPEDFDYNYSTEDIKFDYNIVDDNHYNFIIKNNIYCLTIEIYNILKEIIITKELNGNKFELTIEYDCNY